MEILNIFSIFSGLPLKMLSMYVQTSAAPGTFGSGFAITEYIFFIMIFKRGRLKMRT